MSVDTGEQSLDEQQAELTEEYIALRAVQDDAKAKRKLSRVAGKIDNLYWKRVERLIADRISADQDELAFTDDERLLIDMGLLDIALVEGASDDLPQRLLQELQRPGPTNHFYLSEWLEDRYRRYRLTAQMAAASTQAETPDETDKVNVARSKVFARLGSLFESLPGVNRDIVAALKNGYLDEQILRLNFVILTHPHKKLFLQRRRLWNLRAQVLQKARARATDQATLKLFDALDEIYSIEWRERYKVLRQGNETEPVHDTPVEKEPTGDAVKEYLVSELRFVKTILPIGALAGGVTRSYAVLLTDGPRVTKTDTAAGLALAESCDRGFNVKPVVLIAPFRGRGIFEWDRDSLVLPLVPSENAEDAVANAAGNYHMLIDTLQNNGAMRKKYESYFPDANYQESFQSDYRNWVAGVGHGHDEALEETRFLFFKEHVGPACNEVLAPANLRNLGPQTRQAIRKRIEKQFSLMAEPDAKLRHRLAVLCWQDGEHEEAAQQLAQAVKLAPNNGMMLFSLGLLLSTNNEPVRAKSAYESCAAHAGDTIWGVYARAALADGIEAQPFEPTV